MTDRRKPWEHGNRESRHKRGYGRQHVKLRAQLLAKEPLCRHCKAKGKITAAAIADHIVSLAQGGAAHDLTNLQPLCDPCHRRKTLAEQGKSYRERKQIGPDGWPVE